MTGVAAAATGETPAAFIDACTSNDQSRSAHPAPALGLILADAGTEAEPWSSLLREELRQTALIQDGGPQPRGFQECRGWATRAKYV